MRLIFSLVLGFSFLFSSELYSTHIRAGEIIAKRISTTSLTYEFTIIGYTDTGSEVEFGGGKFDFGDGNIIEVLDEDMNVIRMIGLGNPFYIHVQHIDFEDRPIFGGDIERNFDISVPVDSNAAYITFNEQTEFGLKQINAISID